MAETTYFPRRLILAGAIVSGVLLALAVHMLGVRARQLGNPLTLGVLMEANDRPPHITMLAWPTGSGSSHRLMAR